MNENAEAQTESDQNAGNVGNAGNAENAENTENVENAENVENIENVEDAEHVENIENIKYRCIGNGSGNVRGSGRRAPGSAYLIACDARERERRKELLYDVLGPVFFGEREAANGAELAELFRVRYGIDVGQDFYEGDDHYEEYQEARQAIAEGMDIYGGEIVFDDGVLAELAERVWKLMEEKDRVGFRRINTMLEE